MTGYLKQRLGAASVYWTQESAEAAIWMTVHEKTKVETVWHEEYHMI